MNVLAWVTLILLAAGILVVVLWAAIRWFRGIGSIWIAGFFSDRSHTAKRRGRSETHR